jgi:hypothetical protein
MIPLDFDYLYYHTVLENTGRYEGYFKPNYINDSLLNIIISIRNSLDGNE